ncbi:MAG: MerR family transcriptional regulator [Micropruina sp.]
MDSNGNLNTQGSDDLWRIGELAERSGLSVRTLHHYDQIGLVPPSHRTQSGHRRYTAEDVARLHAVLALRDLGLPLAEVKDVIDTDAASMHTVLRQQLVHLDEQIHSARALRRKVSILLESDPDEALSMTALFELMEGMTAMATTMTASEYEAAVAHRNALPAEERTRLVEERRKKIAECGEASLAQARANRDRMIP